MKRQRMRGAAVAPGHMLLIMGLLGACSQTPGSDDPSRPGPAPGSDAGAVDMRDPVTGLTDTDGGAVTQPPRVRTFDAVADTYVAEDAPSTNFGGEGRLRTDQGGDERSYVKFAVSGVSAPVTRATLRLLALNGSSHGPAVHRTASAWSEATLTWNLQPDPSGEVLADAGAVPTDTWVEFDVTQAVEGDGEVAFVLLPSSSDGCDFSSREGTAAPELVVEFGGGSMETPSDTMAPSVTLLSPLSGQTVSGTVVLTAEASDDVGVTGVQFQWDSESFGPPDTTPPYGFEWDTTAFNDGFYTLTAVARDGEGNQTISNLVTVSVANRTDTGEPPPPPPPSDGAVLRVPEDHGSIQAAIDAAESGDTVVIADGTYPGGLQISGKAITLASHYVLDGNDAHIGATTVNDGSPIVEVAASAAGTRIIGLTFTEGRKGVQAFGTVEVLNNQFLGVGSDAMSFEGTGGVVRGNLFDDSGDDAIDADGPEDALIENNILLNSGDDGIEIRNFDYSGTLLTIVIRGNQIDTSGEDGIQIIDYPDTSARRFIIEKNLITRSADVGLGLMDSGETVEDFRAASVPERVHVLGNTFADNHYGITGGDNLVAVNNIISGCTGVGIKRTDGNSAVAHNLFFANATDQEGTPVDPSTTLYSDPRFLGAEYRLGAGSPAIDAGTATFVFRGETVLRLSGSQYAGVAPDLGYREAQ